MKIQVLNKLLKNDRVYGVRFVFEPQALPINNEGVIVPVNEATTAHFATVVLVSDLNFAPAILEFPLSIKDGLHAYASRHAGLKDIEILLSRESDGELRMTTGRTAGLEDVEVQAAAASSVSESLYNKYVSKVGYKVNDFKQE